MLLDVISEFVNVQSHGCRPMSESSLLSYCLRQFLGLPGPPNHEIRLLLTYACRTAIASVLLVAGILWLARTTSISELMLNAVALNAILDVDEFLFVGMTPIKIQHAIQSLEPMRVKYSRRRSECESVVHFISLVALVSCAYLFQLGPLTEAMLSLKNELCGGNQGFVVGFNPENSANSCPEHAEQLGHRQKSDRQ